MAPDVLFADLLSGEGLTDHASSFVRRDLLRAIADHLPAGAPGCWPADMVAQLTGIGSGIDVVTAAAGTGRTCTLDAAREAWQAVGNQVRGAALAGRAAQELRSSAAIPSSTLAMLQIDLDAGGVLTGLAERLEPVELVENRRQRVQWERQALAELRLGDVDTAFATYGRQGRVVAAPTAIEVRQAMVADWWSHRLAGDTAALLAVRRSDVDDLNGRARAYLQRACDVSGPELVIDQRP